MPEWISIPPFVDGQVVRANPWQDFVTNLNGLQRGEYEVQQMPGPPTQEFTTNSLSFVDIDSTYYRRTIQSHGGDLLIVAYLELFHSSGSLSSHVRLTIDGVAIGNSDGLYAVFGNGDGSGHEGNVNPLIYIAENINAGSHEIVVQFKSSAAGTALVSKNQAMQFWILELH